MTRLTRRGMLGGLLAAGLGPVFAGEGRAEGLSRSTRPRSRPGRQAIARAPADIIAAAELGGQTGYAVLDAATGQMIDSHLPDLRLAPASTLKTVTALYALDRLGPAHRFQTRVLRAGDDLILAGGGDPVLSTDDLAALAKALAVTGTGAPKRFLVWGGALPSFREIAPAQAPYLPYNPAISGMILNFNRVHLDWRRDKAGGYALSLQARAARNSPRAYSISAGVADRRQPLFRHDQQGDIEHWSVARPSLGASGSRWLPVRRPELYAGDVFQTLCRAEGLALPAPQATATLPDAVELARHDSPDLREIVRGMLEYSTNLTAEALGLAASGAGSIRGSAAAMGEWLRAAGISGDFRFVDHSGLGGDNRITALALAQATWRGRAAGLAPLLKRVRIRDAKGHTVESALDIRAKTGTLNFVSTLTGFAGVPGGREVVFAILSADMGRRAATEGQESPAGLSAWLRRARHLQQLLIEGWVAG